MKASEYIAAALAKKRVPAVFELSGGMITHILDALYLDGRTRIISMHHEQGAAFAAEAAGRVSGVPGVALATSGPGAINLLTGIGSCYFDSTPAVFITGQVNRQEQKGARSIRQLGFQEADIVSVARPLTKRAWMVQSAEELPAALDEAFDIAGSGRPGPVLLDIPMDVQRDTVPDSALPRDAAVGQSEVFPPMSARDLDAIRHAVLTARRPIILLGGGIRSARLTDTCRNLVDILSIPAVHSLMGTDVLPSGHPLNAGMIGSYGNRWANLALHEADCLLVLGSRLDVRQTGSRTESFKGTRPVFHVDVEAGEMNNRIPGCHAIHSELAPVLDALTEAFGPLQDRMADQTAQWRGRIAELRRRWPDTDELSGVNGINPNIFMHQLSRAADVAAYVVDVGQHQMWAAQSLEISDHQRVLTSGGMGAMGFALPAAIGAAVCLPGKKVVMIAGDGGFQCNIQELQTVARLKLNLKMVVINNRCHGMVRQFQESYFEGRYPSTVYGYSAPDFVRVAEAYGIPGRSVEDPCGVGDAVDWLLQTSETSDGPALLEVMISPKANAYPKLAFGHGLDKMEPLGVPSSGRLSPGTVNYGESRNEGAAPKGRK